MLLPTFKKLIDGIYTDLYQFAGLSKNQRKGSRWQWGD